MADLMTGSIKIQEKGAKAATSSVSNSFKKMVAAGAALYGLKKTFDFFAGAVKDATTQLQLNAQINAQLAGNLGLEGENLAAATQSILAYSSAKAYQVSLYDEEITKIAGMLTVRAEDEEQLKQLTNLTIDYMAVSGKSWETASRDMIKALDGQDRMMSQYLDTSTEGLDLTDRMETAFGGLAETMYNQGGAAFENINKLMADTKEGFGMGITQSGLFQDAISILADGASDSAASMSEIVGEKVRTFINNLKLFVDSLVSGVLVAVGTAEEYVVHFVGYIIRQLGNAFRLLREQMLKIPIEIFQAMGEGALKFREAIEGGIANTAATLIKAGSDLEGYESSVLSLGHSLQETAVEGEVANSMLETSYEDLETVVTNTNNQIARSSGTTTQRVLADLEKVADKVAGSINGIINLTKKNLNSLKWKADEIMSGTASKLMEDATTTGTDVGMTLGQNIFSSLEAMSGKGNTEVMDIIWKFMKSLIKMALDKFMDTVSGGLWGFVGGLVGSLFGAGEVAGGGAMVVNNINAMDVESFREYNYSYGQQSELQGWL